MEIKRHQPELKKGDRIMLIHMNDVSPVVPGTQGTVTGVSNAFGDLMYDVNWDTGSKLSLVPSQGDRWKLKSDIDQKVSKIRSRKDDSNIEESVTFITKKNFLNENFYKDNKDLFKNFKHTLLRKYLKSLRESGVTNMLGASPYLYLGSEKIGHMHHYEDFTDDRQEAFDQVLEMSDEVRMEMISGSIKVLEKEGKEITPRSVERVLQTYAQKMVTSYFKMSGGGIPNK